MGEIPTFCLFLSTESTGARQRVLALGNDFPMSLPIVDTHQHLWAPQQFSYTWMKGEPSIRKRSLIEEYREATRGFDIVRTVYVDTDVDEQDLAAEARLIFSLADDPANRLDGAVMGAKMEKADPLSHLQPYLKHPKLKGIRRILHTQPDELSQQPQFIANVQSLTDHNLSFDLCVLARQLPLALKLVRQCPRVNFIVDHCGVPDIKGGGMDPWRAHLRSIAGEPNVTCKISGLVAYVDPKSWKAEDLRPYIEHTIACFGWDRVMWGGDWPVCTLTCSLADWLNTALALTLSASTDQRDRLFRRNAERVYRLA